MKHKLYRTTNNGVVIRQGKSLDDSPLPKGTLLDPGNVNQEDAERLLSRGLLEEVSVNAKAAPAKKITREPDEVPPVVLPRGRTLYRVAAHHVIVCRAGSPEQTPYPKDTVLPPDSSRDDIERLLKAGLVTAETHSY